MTRRVAIVAVVLLAVGGCARGEQASVRPSDRAAWSAYRAQVVPDLDRVLGSTAGARAACSAMRASAPAPRFGIDLTRTLGDCARGDLSDARQYAHQQIDHVATNDHALGLLR